ncbi:glycosyltransferase family 2 protein [Candidatus Peregrinibacteria bacterium]|nr:glycosyltransferase family 2 protein [Candidatus Peregrinibacteria bacterium]
MKISCIIVNWNLKYLPRLCIEALKRSQCDFPFEIIVVDNDSHDESLEYLEQMHKKGEITLVHSGSNLGYGRANNLGVKYAKGKYVLILNPDVSVETDTIQKMVDYMEEHPDTGVLGPQLYFFNGQIQDSCRRFMRPADLIIKRTPLQRFKFLKKRVDEYVMTDYDHKNTQDVDLVTGACFMASRAAFEKVGGFDDRYFLFMEDADLCRKMWEAGMRVVYFPLARALHYHKRLSGGSIFWLLKQRVFWIHMHSALKYFWKWRGKAAPASRSER